nr:MAG TPA: hypothetical protein [Caudoviricetes sp.]
MYGLWIATNTNNQKGITSENENRLTVDVQCS